MLESLVSWVLGRYIGDYLEDLNAEQLSVGLLQGQIELENVPLKKSALKKFDIPWRIKSGIIGKLTLTVPLYRLRSQPWLIVINDVFVVLEPDDCDSFDVKSANEYEQKKKRQQLDALLAFHRHQIGQPSEEAQSGWIAYGASLVSLIVENIQMTANNVHVRYEDAKTIAGQRFACGFRIERLSVQSADKHWKCGFVQRTDGDNMFKLLEMVKFVFYWNSNCCLSSPVSHSDLIVLVREKKVLSAVPQDMYILQPVNANVRMEKNCSKFPLKTKPWIPRFKFAVEIDHVSLDVSQEQLSGLQKLLDEWGRFERSRRFRKYRPKRHVSGNCKLWWRFALHCHLESVQSAREGFTWSYALCRARHFVSYVKAYIRLLSQENFSKNDEAFMKQIESEYSYNDVHIMRDVGFKNLLRGHLAISATSVAVTPSPSASNVADSLTEHSSSSAFASSLAAPSLPATLSQPLLLGSPISVVTSVPTMPTLHVPTGETVSGPALPQSTPLPLPLDASASASSSAHAQPGFLANWFSFWYSQDNSGSTLAKPSPDLASAATAPADFELISYGSDASAQATGKSGDSPQLSKALQDDLQLIQSKFEPDILDVINESMDDSTYLRRDNLFLSLSLSVEKMELGYLHDVANHKIKILTSVLDDAVFSLHWSPRRYTVSSELSFAGLSCVLAVNIDEPLPPASAFTEQLFDLGQPFAQILLDSTSIKWRKSEDFISNFEISLDSFRIQDLLKTRGGRDTVEPDCVVQIPQQLASNPRQYKSFLSSSCPDICNWSDANEMCLSTSLPIATTPVAPRKPFPPGTPTFSPQSHSFSKRHSVSQQSTASATFDVRWVSKVHPEFHSKYRGVEVFVSGKIGILQLGFYQQCLALLLDFFGFGGPSVPEDSTMPMANVEPQAVQEIQLQIPLLSLILVKPTDGHILAKLTANDIVATAIMLRKEVRIQGKLGRLIVEDCASSQTNLYLERLLIEPRFKSDVGLKFGFVKFKYSDLNLRREYDALLDLNAIEHGADVGSTVSYVHTQRFVQELLLFVQNFLHLQELLCNVKAGKDATDRRYGFRLRLALEFLKTRIAIPASALSERLLLADMERLIGENTFPFSAANLTSSLESSYDIPTSDLDVLVDALHMQFYNLQLYAALRRDCWPGLHHQHMQLSNSCILKDGEGLFDGDACMTVVVERSLDILERHKVPDLSIYCQISSARLKISLEEHKLIRAILEQNLGESVLNSSYPAALLASQDASDNAKVWQTLRFTLELQNIILDCSAPVAESTSKQSERPLGRVDFIKAKLQVECFCNNDKDIFLSAEQVSVTDMRYCDMPVNKRPNVYTAVIGPKVASSSCATKSSPGHLMAEIHYHASLKDEAKLTVVLSNIRIYWLFDWLIAALNFITTEPDIHNVVVKENLISSEKPGVWTKRLQLSKKSESGLKLLLNLSECELVMLQNPSSLSSLALCLCGTAVLNFAQTGAGPSLKCHLQNAELFSCCLGCEDETLSRIVEQFQCNIEFAPSIKAGVITDALKGSMPRSFAEAVLPPVMKSASVGLIEIAAHHVAHKLKVTLKDFIAEVSYRDWCMIHNLVSAQMLTTFGVGDSGESGRTERAEQQSSVLELVELKLESSALVFLEDTTQAYFPLFRVSVAKASLEQRILSDLSADGKIEMAIDYYNRRVSNWEPFFEQWEFHCNWTYATQQDSVSIDIVGVDEKVLDVTLTPVLLEVLQTLRSEVSSIIGGQAPSAADTTDLRSKSAKRTLWDPYVLLNQTGSKLWFTSDVSRPVLFDGRRQRTLKEQTWREVNAGQSVAFRLYSSYEKGAGNRTHICNKLCVRVDGWSEIASIAIDKDGLFFRVAKAQLANNAATSRLQQNVCANANCRIVIEVKTLADFRKQVSIRSAVMLINALPDALSIRLENKATFLGDFAEIVVPPHDCLSVPLRYVCSSLYAKPRDLRTAQFCKTPITYMQLTQAGKISDSLSECIVGGDDSFTYRFCVRAKREQYPDISGFVLPGHSLCFVPPLTILNLLPNELQVNIGGQKQYVINAGEKIFLTSINIADQVPLKFSMESFASLKSFDIPMNLNSPEFSALHVLTDPIRRILQLKVVVYSIQGGALKVVVSAPFWFVNRSALPLLIRQQAADEPIAGQFAEHEEARSMAPLPFCFADSDIPFACELRLGNRFHPNCSFPWSRPFSLEPGVQFRLLCGEPHDNIPQQIYAVGIDVRKCVGRYKDTNVVVVTARFQLDNRSACKLHVAQLCALKREDCSGSSGERTTDCGQISAPHARPAFYSVEPNSFIAWHWPRHDLDPLLCVRMDGLEHWSCGFRIDQMQSFHLNMRNGFGEPQFLRVEVVLHGAVYYVSFFDASTIPPPMRIENLSEVPILYQQQNCEQSHLKVILRPHSSVNYAWDDFLQPPELKLTVFGSRSNRYDFSKLGSAQPIIYENNFYIAFAATFHENVATMQSQSDECLQLVLDVLPNGNIIVAKKESLKLTQLWRMTSEGFLVNIGATGSSYRHVSVSRSSSAAADMVLDVLSNLTPNSSQPLVLRAIDPRRRLTQCWSFTQDGRLMCGQPHCFVQVANRKLQSNSLVVLGCAGSPNDAAVVTEQWVQKQRSKPGSGCLAVSILDEGPTRVLRISDKNVKAHLHSTDNVTEDAWSQPATLSGPSSSAVAVTVGLRLHGFGVSLISEQLEELIYGRFSELIWNYGFKLGTHKFHLQVSQVQADNQLYSADSWKLLLIKTRFVDKDSRHVPAVLVDIEWTPSRGCDVFKTFCIEIGKTVLRIEEVLLWKLAKLCQSRRFPGSITDDRPNVDVDRLDPSKARRCHFGQLNLVCQRLVLSVLTAGILPPDLRQVKMLHNVPLVRFENASIEIQDYRQSHSMETVDFLVDALRKHITSRLKSQAVKILGTVDFLGNPIGLFNDVTEGFSEFLTEGSFGGFVAGVTHGISNSTAKFTSSLSDGVGKLGMDESHQELREAWIRQPSSSTNALSHVVTGVKGFGLGLFGGVTGVFTQPIDGAMKDGFGGMAWGVVKGAVGVVTKPVQGVLDLTTGIATATKEVVAGAGPHKSRFSAERLRSPRVTCSLSGAVPVFDEELATAQQLLFNINNRNSSEMCLALKPLTNEHGEWFAMVTTENVYVLRQTSEGHSVRLKIYYGELISCSILPAQSDNAASVIELTCRQSSEAAAQKRKTVTCRTMEIALQLRDVIVHAKGRFDDNKRSLPITEDINID